MSRRIYGLHLQLYQIAYQKVKTYNNSNFHFTLSEINLRCQFFFKILDTQQAEYHFIPSITYRANGAVAPSCLRHYVDLVSQYYMALDNVLTQRCSAVNVNMNVTFLESRPELLDDNVVQVRNWQLKKDENYRKDENNGFLLCHCRLITY